MTKYERQAAIFYLCDWKMESLYCTTPEQMFELLKDNYFFQKRVLAIALGELKKSIIGGFFDLNTEKAMEFVRKACGISS